MAEITKTTRQPTERDLALAESVLATLPYLGRIAGRAGYECGVGSPERCRLLFVLKTGPLRSGLLAQHLKLSPAAVTELVESLVLEGSVRRDADPDDRRAVVLTLTAEGRRLVQRYEQMAATALAGSLVRLGPAQRRRLQTAIGDLRSALAAGDPVIARRLRGAFTSSSRPRSTLRRTTHKENVHAK